MNQDRPAYKQFEARMLQLLKWRFERANFRVDDHQKIGELPLEIDLVVISTEQEWIPDVSKLPTIFRYFRRYNIMEVKSEKDRLEIEDLPKLMAYGWLYVARNSIEYVRHVTLTALVHHLTSRIREALPRYGFLPDTQGVFRRDSDITAYVISIADLPDDLASEELQAFSDPIRRKHAFLSCIGNEEKAPIVETIFDLYENEVNEIMALNIRDESVKNAVKALGVQRVIASLSKEELLAALKKEDILKILRKEDFLAALSEEDIAALGGKERLLQLLMAKPERK
ncbi:MAG: hypothetical protein ACREOI_04510 [bacterium]